MKEAGPPQSPEQVASALEAWLADYPEAVITEDGKVLFDLREAKYSLTTEHNRCTLHLWGAERNLVRRVSAALARGKALRLTTHRFGQAKPSTLELHGEKDRRTPSTRDATRTRYLKTLERVLARHFDPWRPEGLRTAMDLEKSFGPAYARGLVVTGNHAAGKGWAVIAVNQEEMPVTVDGILTFGILWLEACRHAAHARHIVGLRVVVPRGMAALTLARMAWLAEPAAHWELYELDQSSEELTRREVGDNGNLTTRLLHAPNPEAAQARFAEASARVMALVPEAFREVVEPHLRSATELAFLLHGLEFARVRFGASGENFNRMERISFGAGAAETELTRETEEALRALVAQLCQRRAPGGDKRDVLYRMQPERWLEGELRRNLAALDPHLHAAHAQVSAFAASDRGQLDLLALTDAGRLAVLEIKADEDPHLALQGLDYWTRVRWHHAQNPDPASGLGTFQRHGYFPGRLLARQDPALYLVAPALRIHSATEVILRHLSPRVEWTLVGLDERWRTQVKVVWRKRSTDTERRVNF